MKTVIFLLNLTAFACIAAAQTPTGCVTPASGYTLVYVSQQLAGAGTSSQTLTRPASTTLLLVPSNSTPAASAAASVLAANPTATPAPSPITQREVQAQITSVVLSSDSCGATPNTLFRVYGTGFGLVSRPAVTVVTIIPVCVTGMNNVVTTFSDGVCATGTTSYVPQAVNAKVVSWADNLVVVDTSIALSAMGKVPVLISVLNNDTETQATFCEPTSSQNCAMSYVLNAPSTPTSN
jgi:hypothetical protein